MNNQSISSTTTSLSSSKKVLDKLDDMTRLLTSMDKSLKDLSVPREIVKSVNAINKKNLGSTVSQYIGGASADYEAERSDMEISESNEEEGGDPAVSVLLSLASLSDEMLELKARDQVRASKKRAAQELNASKTNKATSKRQKSVDDRLDSPPQPPKTK